MLRKLSQLHTSRNCTGNVMLIQKAVFIFQLMSFDLCEFGLIITRLIFLFANQIDAVTSAISTTLDYQSGHQGQGKIPNVLLFWVSVIGQNWLSLTAMEGSFLFPLVTSGFFSFLFPTAPQGQDSRNNLQTLQSRTWTSICCTSGPNSLTFGPGWVKLKRQNKNDKLVTKSQEGPITTGRCSKL